MTVSPLKRFILPSVVLSGAIFSLLTLPLTVIGSEDVVIQLREEPMFHGKVRDVAAPYLGFATALSLGVAVGSVAITGWRESSRKSAQIDEELSTLQDNLKKKEGQIEELKLSEMQLQASGLNFFVDDEVSDSPQPKVSAIKATEITDAPCQQQNRNIQSNAPVKATESKVEPESVGYHLDRWSFTPREQKPAMAYAIADETTYSTAGKSLAVSERNGRKEQPLMQIQELQSQFEQMMSQLQSLQTVLQDPDESTPLQEEVESPHPILEEIHHRLLVLESQRQQHQAVSQSSPEQPEKKSSRSRRRAPRKTA
ncbi:MAG: hypothetical protein KME06_09835 [Kastovskya adunca ATA6-11-RM4]|jgi:hypothetical protein|nr:hypothetical protein [Kastovskya adunca ATA6-11-RM4]